MNTDEREQLTRFLAQLAQAQAVQKDGEADALIRLACARQADAAYLLVQRAMVLDAALRNSQNEIARLQGELEQARSQTPSRAGGGSFIDANSWGNSAPTRQTPLPAAPLPGAALPASAWGSGMLGTIATTAAGVVAGGFIFQGIEHLLGNQRPPSASPNRLSDAAAAPEERAANVEPQEHSGADIFDTSSVDDYIAGDSDGNA